MGIPRCFRDFQVCWESRYFGFCNTRLFHGHGCCVGLRGDDCRECGDDLLAVGQGEVSVEVLMDAYGASEQGSSPSDALDLQGAVFELDGVVAVDHALMVE